VVGGGVVGCFVAYRLAVMGVSVTLLERAGPGSGSTGNSAGNIQPGSGDDDAYKIALGAESLAIWRKHLPQIKESGGTDYREQDVRYLYAATNEEEEREVRRILGDMTAAGLRAEWVDGETAREIEPRLSDSITGGLLHHENERLLVREADRAYWMKGEALLEFGVQYKALEPAREFAAHGEVALLGDDEPVAFRRIEELESVTTFGIGLSLEP